MPHSPIPPFRATIALSLSISAIYRMTIDERLLPPLKRLTLPGFDRPLLAAVQEATLSDDGTATIVLAIAHFGADMQRQTARLIDEALTALDAVKTVRVVARQRMAAPPRAAPQRPATQIIAVGSGKGGVGKSTVAVNLAVALAQQGPRVGLLDADIFGPNVPRMLGVAALPERGVQGMPPAEAHGIKLISVGFLVDAAQAVVWRGPMTDKVLRQFLFDVDWGQLDHLIIDLPPGTGDIAIAIARHAQPDGAIVVTTPQGVAADDARKAIGMFRTLAVPVLGIVENMSYFQCEACGSRHALFGEGGADALAAEMSLPLLAQIPFEPPVRAGGDLGQPIALSTASGAAAAFHDLAAQLQRLNSE